MSRQPITVGELPVEAPVIVNTNSIIVSVSEGETRYWIAPEAILTSAKEGVAVGVLRGNRDKISTVELEIRAFSTPTEVNTFLITDDDIEDWKVRLIPVRFASEVAMFIGPINSYADVNEDRAAEYSQAASRVGNIQESTDDISLWYGETITGMDAKQLMPNMYMRERFRTGMAVAAVGPPIPFHTDIGADNDVAKTGYAAILKSILDSILRVKHKENPHDSLRLFHAAVALYAMTIRAGIGLPRQYDPKTFDGVYTVAATMTQEWRIDLHRICVCLGLEPVKDPNSQWEEEDIVIKFDKQDSMIIADLQNLVEKHHDGIFQSFLVKVNDPQIARGLPRIDEIIEYLAEYGISIDPEGFDPNEAYMYATHIGFKNSVFREWMLREPNEKTGISISLFEDDDLPENPPTLPSIEG